MLSTTKGIVIHHFKYSEKSVIAKVYTEKYGLQSYIVNGVRNKKSKNKAAYLQALSLVEITANHKDNKGLQRVNTIELETPFNSIPFDIGKSTVAFFLAEILYKAIKEEEVNTPLFEFLNQTIQVLDLSENGYSNFHLIFLINLSKYLGFYPQNTQLKENVATYFDLQEGLFTSLIPYHKAFIDPPAAKLLQQAIGTNFELMSTLILNNQQRKMLLSAILNYYSLHLSNFDNLKTLEILEEILY
jgi:DNA repair protein RecO (recombination protein O)